MLIVDPVSTGACFADYAASHGQQLARIWSDMCPDTIKNHTQHGLAEIDWQLDMQYMGDTDAIVRAVAKAGFCVSDVLPGCETGVLCADCLAAAFGVRGSAPSPRALLHDMRAGCI